MTPEEELRAIDQRLSAMDELSQIDAQLAQMDQQPQEAAQPEKPGFSWPRFLGEMGAQGVIDWANIPQALAMASKALSSKTPSALDMANQTAKKHGLPEQKSLLPSLESLPMASEKINELVKHAGIDLRSQGEGDTPFQRMVGSGVRTGASMLMPVGGAANIAKNVGLGALQGVGSQGLKEVGANPIMAELTSLAGTAALPGAIRGAKNALTGKHLTESESLLADYIRKTMGEEYLEKALANIEKTPAYEMTGYQPMTAEVAGKESPLFAQLHRLREGKTGSGIPEQTNLQNIALERQFGKQSSAPASSHEVQSAVNEKLSKANKHRDQETREGYKIVENMQEGLPVTNTENYLNSLTVRGDLEKDVNWARDLLKPRKKPEGSLAAKQKQYDKEVSIIEQSALRPKQKQIEIAKLEKPGGNNPTVAEVSAAKKAINARIEDYKKAGKKSQSRQLKEIKSNLEKDLSGVPLEAKTTAQYRELSKPVNDILEHKAMKNISESKANNLYTKLFDKNSTDNLKQLKKVLGENSPEWEGIQHGVVDHLKRSISNRGEVFSYDKFHKFLEKHQGALEVVLTPDQMKFVQELKSGLHGRNIAATLGAAPGSPTAHHLMNALGLNQGVGSKLLTTASYVPGKLKIPGAEALGKSFRFMLNRAAKNKEVDVMGALDNILKHPEEATRILKKQFKSQSEFNKYLQSMAPTVARKIAIPHMTIHLREKEKEKNNE